MRDAAINSKARVIFIVAWTLLIRRRIWRTSALATYHSVGSNISRNSLIAASSSEVSGSPSASLGKSPVSGMESIRPRCRVLTYSLISVSKRRMSLTGTESINPLVTANMARTCSSTGTGRN